MTRRDRRRTNRISRLRVGKMIRCLETIRGRLLAMRDSALMGSFPGTISNEMANIVARCTSKGDTLEIQRLGYLQTSPRDLNMVWVTTSVSTLNKDPRYSFIFLTYAPWVNIYKAPNGIANNLKNLLWPHFQWEIREFNPNQVVGGSIF